ncbi:hypothetical protein CDAR_64031 [Caerostris darwini]|uniref:Uncharacterized protein n=1 Tax=Caerostris darwini TaxID=1538125 RepID=A0AAV4NPN8_9ARAC|nr:hypothetical protein CDAR_64031 [Caerostris darwini]
MPPLQNEQKKKERKKKKPCHSHVATSRISQNHPQTQTLRNNKYPTHAQQQGKGRTSTYIWPLQQSSPSLALENGTVHQRQQPADCMYE